MATPSSHILPAPTDDSARNADAEHILVASVMADLAKDCDIAFSRPSSVRHSFKSETLSPVRPRNYNMKLYPRIKPDYIKKHERTQTDTRYHRENIHAPRLVLSYQSSERSSLSRLSNGYIGDSTLTLVEAKGTQKSTKSRLRKAQSADEERAASTEQQPAYPSAAKTAIIMVSLYISIFLVALDRTIIGPAIPAITNQFNSIGDIGWYGSAYMLTSSGFILLYGRIYTFFPTKPVFLSGIVLFETGSAVCGAAQSSIMLIIGRAIAGLGSSGIFTGAILIMLNTVPLHRRPLLQGLFGACFGVASVAGPLLGGAFTGSKLTWRWCFYINLPLGAITIAVAIFLLKLDETKQKPPTWKQTILHLDPLGTLLFLPAITCLLLALQWGAAEYSWNSPRLIALLATFAVLFTSFIAWQYFTRNTTATVPARIVAQRSVACGGASQFCVGSTMLTVSIYIPLWFQAIKQVSAMQSGINTIPLVLSVVVGSIMSGGLVQRLGYYTPFMILGSVLMSVGAGLLTTWTINTSSAMWIGYQVILGFGVGCTMQHANLAVQVVLPKQDIPIGTAVLSLCQTLGGAVFAAVGQNLYIDRFSSALGRIGGWDPSRVLRTGATDLTNAVPPALRPRVLLAYNDALTKGTFFAALIIACLAFPAALGMEWRSVKERQGSRDGGTFHDEVIAEPKQERLAAGGLFQRPRASSNQSDISDLELPAPKRASTNIYRSSGQFFSYMTAKANPDLRAEINARMEGR